MMSLVVSGPPSRLQQNFPVTNNSSVENWYMRIHSVAISGLRHSLRPVSLSCNLVKFEATFGGSTTFNQTELFLCASSQISKHYLGNCVFPNPGDNWVLITDPSSQIKFTVRDLASKVELADENFKFYILCHIRRG